MRIQIRAGGRNFTLPIPTGLIFSRPSVWLYLKLARGFSSGMDEYIPQNAKAGTDAVFSGMPEEAVYAICDELRRIRKKHGSWDLVEVEAADGQSVRISL